MPTPDSQASDEDQHSQSQNPEDGLFSDLLVLDMGTWIAAPVATTILADYGARVIKIEMPGTGDDYRWLTTLPGMPQADVNYTWLMDGRNKESITLNLKADEGQRILHSLVEHCDVLVTNQPMPVRERFKTGYDDLKHLNPSMIYASLTAYGESGPDRDLEGFDLVAYWARTGLMDRVRAVGAEPAGAVPGMGDHPSAITLYSAIVTALLRRERTGEGSHVHTSLLANGVWAASCLAQAGWAGASFPEPGSVAHRTLYPAADGRYLQITMIRTPERIDALLTMLGVDELIGRFAEVTPAEFNERVAEGFARHSSDEWLTAAAEAGLPISRIGRFDELPDDPQVQAAGVLLPPPAGSAMPVIDHPINVDGLPRESVTRAPDVGEHTRSVLTELGYNDEDIRKLATAGVI